MRRFSIAVGALLACALAASSTAAGSTKGFTDPTCTATATGLTCTGKAAGVQPRSIFGLSSVEAGIKGEVHYTCTDPVFEVLFFGFPTLAPPDYRYLAGADFHNGRTFSVEFLPPPNPPGMLNAYLCLSGEWTRDPSYYNVKVVVGWGFGSATPIEAREAPIGTVSPG